MLGILIDAFIIYCLVKFIVDEDAGFLGAIFICVGVIICPTLTVVGCDAVGLPLMLTACIGSLIGCLALGILVLLVYRESLKSSFLVAGIFWLCATAKDVLLSLAS